MVGDSGNLIAFKDAMVFLGAAGVAVPLLRRIRVNPVLGFMLAGFAIGPHGIGAWVGAIDWLKYITITDQAAISELAELGVIFLLFTIGLELSIKRLWGLRRLVFGLGGLQIVITAALLGGLALAYGLSPVTAIIAGLGLALSSTAVGVQVLVSRHRFATPQGQTVFAILLMQDLMVVPILFLVGVVGAASEIANDMANTLIWGTVAIGGVILAGRYLVVPMMRGAAHSGSHELFVAMMLLVALGSALATGLAGLSTALGAFLAGLLLSASEFKHQVEADIEPFKGLLLGLFFVTVGMSVDPTFIALHALEVFLGLLALTVIKLVVTAALVAIFRPGVAMAAEVSFLLAHSGEFTLILLGAAASTGVMPMEIAQMLVAVTVLSMALVPMMDEAGRRFGALLEGRRHELPTLVTGDRDGQVIIGGFGRVGRTIAEVLEAENLPWLALDTDTAVVSAARREGLPVFFGDASRKDVLMRAGANRAPAFVVTLAQPQLAERMVRSVREEWPQAMVYARAKDWRHASHLRHLGVDNVTPEAVEGSLKLAAQVLCGLGLDEGVVRARIDAHRLSEAHAHDGDVA